MLFCELDAWIGAISVQSQLSTVAPAQPHLSCRAAALQPAVQAPRTATGGALAAVSSANAPPASISSTQHAWTALRQLMGVAHRNAAVQLIAAGLSPTIVQ